MRFTKGDHGVKLRGVVNAVLTGATVEIHLAKPDGSAPVTKTAVVTDGPNGIWEYTWSPGDLNVSGVWYVEAEALYQSGARQTFGPTRFHVVDQIA